MNPKKTIDLHPKIRKELEIRKKNIKPFNDRISKLREESIKTKVSITSERAELITQFSRYNSDRKLIIPIERAMLFKHLMENVSLPLEKNQLILGVRGNGVKKVPTYPEICCHNLKDLDFLSSREKNPYYTDSKIKSIYEKDIIPFWNKKSIREIIFSNMSPEWKTAYEIGVFTEFMEQRSPGHTSGGERIFRMGLLDIKKEIKKKIEEISQNNSKKYGEIDELKAMEIVADALIIYADRYRKKLEKMAKLEKKPKRKKELMQMVEISRWVPANAPRTFWEALQHYWYIHVGIVYETNPWDSFCPGRLDKHLYPFYEKDIKKNILTRDRAKELLEAFWLKFNNQPAPPKVGITSHESNTYNDFSKINIGGLKSDGTNNVNEISYLLLEVLKDMRTVQPNTAILLSEKTPNEFLEKSLEVISPGFGEPPLFNFDGIIMQLLRQGKSLEDARIGGSSGCVESGAFGKESYILTGYFNLVKILEITLNNGIDPITKKKVGIKTGEVSIFKSFDELFKAFTRQLKHFVDIKIKGNDIIEDIYAKHLPVPFLSLWIDDCVKSAKDYNLGGARYNTQYIQFVGLGSLTDSLESIKYNIYEKQLFSINQVLEALDQNYTKSEDMRQIFINKTPKFGNDDNNVDEIAKKIFQICVKITEENHVTTIRKASHRANFLPTTVHEYFGGVCGATPDGRKAKTPLSEGISPVQGSDKKGIAAVFCSIGKLDHTITGGTLLNQRLSPDLISEKETIKKFAQLIRAYFRMGGHHVQFNVVSTDLLREAQNNPKDFQDLMVRVAGYSDYFVNLTKGLQEEIITRTEHKD